MRSALLLCLLALLIPLQSFGDDIADSQILKDMYDADQAVRSQEFRESGKAPSLQEERDRRFAVLKSISEGATHTANDFFHAGMILHHTSSIQSDDGHLASLGTESHLMAFFLFLRAHKLGHDSGLPMMAAAYNYYLRACGEEAGKYGYKFEGRSPIWRPNVESDELKCGFDPRPYIH